MKVVQTAYAVSLALLLNTFGSYGAIFRVPLKRTTVAWSLELRRDSNEWRQLEDKHDEQSSSSFVLQDGKRGRTYLRGTEEGPEDTLSSFARHHQYSQNIPAKGSEDVYYYILYTTDIKLGNPPQTFRAQVDIGWGDVFVPSWNCTYDSHEAQYCLPHNMYNSSQSSSYVADLSPASIRYIGIYTWGNVSQDSLYVGGVEIKNQIFEEAIMWRPVPLFWDELLDSALGLARLPLNFSVGSTIEARNPFRNMIGQNLLDRNIFSMRLARTDKEKGELIFGAIDEDVYTGDLVELPATNVTCGDNEAIAVYSSSGWQIPVHSISLSSNASSGPFHAALPNYTAILSTEYPYIALSVGLAQQLAEHCGVYLGSALSCEERILLPNLTFVLGPVKQEIVLTPWDYMIEVENETYGTRCVLPFETLMEWLDGFHYIILGTAFLSGLYSVFDYDNQTISLAKAKWE